MKITLNKSNMTLFEFLLSHNTWEISRNVVINNEKSYFLQQKTCGCCIVVGPIIEYIKKKKKRKGCRVSFWCEQAVLDVSRY